MWNIRRFAGGVCAVVGVHIGRRENTDNRIQDIPILMFTMIILKVKELADEIST